MIILRGAALVEGSLPLTLADDKAALTQPAILPGDTIREPAGTQCFINALRGHPEFASFPTLAIGYNTGPLFFRGLKSTAGPQIGLTLLLCVTALLTARLLGLSVITLGRVELGLSLFVGVLLVGLVYGWLRSIYPRFGRIPALGYGVGCALGNVVLALWGGVIIVLMVQ